MGIKRVETVSWSDADTGITVGVEIANTGVKLSFSDDDRERYVIFAPRDFVAWCDELILPFHKAIKARLAERTEPHT